LNCMFVEPTVAGTNLVLDLIFFLILSVYSFRFE
jgi:hypothetical protein